MSSNRYRADLPPTRRPRAAAPSPRLRRASIQREQALCQDAIESDAYDALTDKQWVELCERTGREEAAPDGDAPGEHESD